MSGSPSKASRLNEPPEDALSKEASLEGHSEEVRNEQVGGVDTSVVPTVEVSESGDHVKLEMRLDTCLSEEETRSSAVDITELETDVVDITRDLENLRRDLEAKSRIDHLAHPEPTTSTIANTAADVMHIRKDLDQLQEHLARVYPMTDEEKMECRIPACSLNGASQEDTRLHSRETAELSLDDACALLRGASRHRTSCDALATIPVALPKTGDSVKRGSRPIGATSDFNRMDEEAIPSSCGDELRSATQVLKRRLQNAVASR